MDTHGVTVRRLRFLRGPNLHAYMPVMHITLDIAAYEECPSSSFRGFTERLTAWLPGLHEHKCGLGYRGGFVERLRTGTYLGHIAEHVTLELQNLMGFDVAFGRARGTAERGVYTVVIAYKEEEPARAAFETALRLTLAAMHYEPFDIGAELEDLLAIADDYRLGPSTAAIVEAARARDIPVLRLTQPGSLVQMGYGVHQRRIRATETSNTSAIAAEMCQEKPLTNKMLRMVGVSVPEGRAVASVDDAWAAAQEIGLPVVVKPESGNQGKGVSVNLRSEAEVRAAYVLADDFRGDVLVEQHIHGHDYRLLVVNGTMVAASRRDPAQVIGDGTRTVRQLVDEVNSDPRRRPGHSSSLTRIRLDSVVDLVLRQQGLTLDSVPAAWQKVLLRTNSNLSTGGTATDVTDEVHPSNVRLAEAAAQIMDMDVAGIDVVCRDIRVPLREQRGAIVEVNAAPGLRMHLDPSAGRPRQVGVPIVEMLYPNGAPSRIPIIAVTGTNGKTTVTRLISHMYETAHRVVGMTCTEGIYIDGERIVAGDCSGPASARTVLLHPRVEVAVLETARGGILREGLAFDRCDVGVVTNVSGDHLGIGGVETVEDLAKVKQVVVENVAKNGAAVLNAADPLVAEMAAATDAPVVYFDACARNHVITAHLAAGGRAVVVDHGAIVLATGNERVDLVDLERIPFTAAGGIAFQVQNALAATAAAWAAGLNPALIARALSTFTSDHATVPGRFNVSDMARVQVILDYGHNAAALRALGQAVKALPPRRTVLMIGLPGDRRDDDLSATIEATLPWADEYVLYDQENDRRGRAPGEMPRLLQRCVPAQVPSQVADSQAEGMSLAWQRVRPGDRLVVIPAEVDGAFEQLQHAAAASDDEATCGPSTNKNAAVAR